MYLKNCLKSKVIVLRSIAFNFTNVIVGPIIELEKGLISCCCSFSDVRDGRFSQLLNSRNTMSRCGGGGPYRSPRKFLS